MTSFDLPTESPMREIRAVGPHPDAEALRASYLALLKLCLCDLTGASTREVTSDRDKRLFSRELTGEDQLRSRVEGRDWPLDGLTMVGLRRLDDLQRCVDLVVRDGVEGDLIEAGAWRGGASILIRATLDSLGADQRTLWVADSFQGFPVPDDGDIPADRELESHMREIQFPVSTLETVRGYFARFGCERGVRFVAGFFEDTMAELRGRRWSLVRLDADTYKATKLALKALYPGLAMGGYLILDDYFHPLLPEGCRRAVDDFRREQGILEPIVQIDWTGARWRRESQPSAAAEAALRSRVQAREEVVAGEPDAGRWTVPEPVSAQPTAVGIPTDRELALADEVTALRERLQGVESELRERGRSRVGPAAVLMRHKKKPGG
jgi:O-methyltransferase